AAILALTNIRKLLLTRADPRRMERPACELRKIPIEHHQQRSWRPLARGRWQNGDYCFPFSFPLLLATTSLIFFERSMRRFRRYWRPNLGSVRPRQGCSRRFISWFTPEPRSRSASSWIVTVRGASRAY